MDFCHHYSFTLAAQREGVKTPALYWLSGLTCNEQNFITKACCLINIYSSLAL